MPPNEEYTTSAGVTMKGKLAEVFDELFFEAFRKKEVRSRAEFGRKLIVAQLRSMGYEVEDDMEWGGSRKEDDEGQPVAEAVA